MIRTLLMALGAYTLYRMYVPLEQGSKPRELLSDLRKPTAGTPEGAQQTSGAQS